MTNNITFAIFKGSFITLMHDDLKILRWMLLIPNMNVQYYQSL